MSQSRNAPQTRQSLWALFAVAFLTLVALAGCGNGEDDESNSELTHAQVVKQGDSVCARTSTTASKELTTRIKKLPQGLTPETEEELILTVTVPAIEAMAADLSEIEAVPKEKQELEAISTAFIGGAAKIKTDPRATSQAPFAKAAGLAGAFGFVECSKF